jgi:chemotaxis protein MotB
MRKQFVINAFLYLGLVLVSISCGPSKELLVSQAKVETLQKEIANTRTQLSDCNTKVESMFQEKASLQTHNALVQEDLKDINTESEMTIADQAKRLKTLQEMIKSQKAIMSNLQNSIAEALMNYSADELSVYIKDGNVYVSLAEKLLYKSGSDVVDPKGKEALASLAKVLNSTKDIRVMIEGHTDNVPISSKQFEDNWDLSTARATSIVRILTTDFGFDSNRITASGRSQFHPVKTNDTPEGRAGNRRTEVILSPDLKELYTILYQ